MKEGLVAGDCGLPYPEFDRCVRCRPPAFLPSSKHYPCHVGSGTCPSEPLVILRGHGLLFQGHSGHCSIEDLRPTPAHSPVSTFGIYQTEQRANPLRVAPHHAQTTSIIQNALGGRTSRQTKYVQLKLMGPSNGYIGGRISMYTGAYHIHITCSVIDPTS